MALAGAVVGAAALAGRPGHATLAAADGVGLNRRSRAGAGRPPDGPRTEAALQRVLKACLAVKVACGCPVVGPAVAVTEAHTAKRFAGGSLMLTVNTSAR